MRVGAVVILRTEAIRQHDLLRRHERLPHQRKQAVVIQRRVAILHSHIVVFVGDHGVKRAVVLRQQLRAEPFHELRRIGHLLFLQRIFQLIYPAVVQENAVVVQRAHHAKGIQRLPRAEPVPQRELVKQVFLRILKKRPVEQALARQGRRLRQLAPLGVGHRRIRQQHMQKQQAEQDGQKAANQKPLTKPCHLAHLLKTGNTGTG